MKPFYEYLMSFDDYKMKPLRGNPLIKTKVIILICERSEILLRKMQTSLLHASHEQATLVKLQSNFIAQSAIRALARSMR